MHFESCFSLSGSNNPRGQENVKCVVIVSFLLSRFFTNLIFVKSVYITVGSECVHHHIVKMQSHKFTEGCYLISPFHRPGNFPYHWQQLGIKSACELLTAGPALFTP